MVDSLTPCDPNDPAGDLPPPNPFLAPRYFFGMLLGVNDLETEHAYHVGKTRLHNAWLHGVGVVCGYDVSAHLDSGEVRVKPGLALDGAGRELYLSADVCVHAGTWYAKHEKDIKPSNAAAPVFNAHVVARFRPCLTRQVPALAQPCGGVNTDTAYSRVAETVELLLRPGLAKAPPTPPFPRLREAFAAGRPGAVAFRSLAAADAIDRGTLGDGSPVPLFPESDADTEVVLANLTGVTLQTDGTGWKLTAAGVDNSVRQVLLPTATIQDLVAGPGGGPRVVAAALEADHRTVRFEFDQTVIVPTLADAISVTLLPTDGLGKWAAVSKIEPVAPDPLTPLVARVRVTATAANAVIPAKTLVRVVLRGTGPTPLTGTNLAPLAGGDFVFTTRRN